MAESNFQSTVEALFKGMDSFITSKTVVGDAIHVGDTIILPLVDVSFGVAAGAFAENAKKDQPERGSGHQQKRYKACKCQESGCHHEDS